MDDGRAQNVLSLDICSTAGSQVESDLREALALLREGAEVMPVFPSTRPRVEERWKVRAKAFEERFPDFPT